MGKPNEPAPLSPSELEAQSRVTEALELIETAQGFLEFAAQQLSGCVGVLAQWKGAGQLREKVCALWHSLNERREKGRGIDLDGLAKQRLEQGHTLPRMLPPGPLHSSPVPPGYDPRTGVHRESLLWALSALSKLSPAHVRTEDELAEMGHWLNTMAGLCNAFLRAGGKREALRQFEREGFTLDEPGEGFRS